MMILYSAFMMLSSPAWRAWPAWTVWDRPMSRRSAAAPSIQGSCCTVSPWAAWFLCAAWLGMWGDISNLSQEARAVVSDVTQLTTHSLSSAGFQHEVQVLCCTAERKAGILGVSSTSHKTTWRGADLHSERNGPAASLKTLDETIKVFEDDFVQSKSDVAHWSSLCDYNRLVIEGGWVAARFVTKVTNCAGTALFFFLLEYRYMWCVCLCGGGDEHTHTCVLTRAWMHARMRVCSDTEIQST